ncbi:MAG: pyridoxamine 5'-phosphate oxidase [Robiginitomaculum sp.]|nr:pyridoxamine 5'-phosphate oxidase [Robiginitomaculum sp.]
MNDENENPSNLRDDYHEPAADEPVDMFRREDPISLFADWFELAKANEPNDANAMTLATVDANGLPDARAVLLKEFSETGFVFYTNVQSAKGEQLLANPQAALVFHWKSVRRQVRLRGPVTLVSAEEADAYFASRARTARIGAHASEQSRALPSRFVFEQRIAAKLAKFGTGPIPRPQHWSGFRVQPVQIEFWRDRPFRLHDRLQFTRKDGISKWKTGRLYP